MWQHLRRRPTAHLAGGLVVLVALLGVAVVAVAGLATRPDAPREVTPADGQVLLVLSAPNDVLAQVLVPGTDATVIKPRGTTEEIIELSMEPGTHRIEPLLATLGGLTWQANPVGEVEVAAGESTRVELAWREVARPVQVQVTGTTGDSVSLEWRSSIENATYVVRRTVGDTPPATPEDGVAVRSGRARSVVDAGLPPDTIHTYAVFARGEGDGLPPATVTTATLPVGPRISSAASYSMLAHASVVEPRDADVVSLVGDEVWVELEPSRAVPVTGAGMALPASDALPGGFLGIVAEVAPDGRSVRLEEAGLHQVFARYELSTSFRVDVSGTPRRPAPRVRGSAEV